MAKTYAPYQFTVDEIRIIEEALIHYKCYLDRCTDDPRNVGHMSDLKEKLKIIDEIMLPLQR